METMVRLLRDRRGVGVIGYAQITTAASILAVFGVAAVSGNLYDLLTDLALLSEAAFQAFGEV